MMCVTVCIDAIDYDVYFVVHGEDITIEEVQLCEVTLPPDILSESFDRQIVRKTFEKLTEDTRG